MSLPEFVEPISDGLYTIDTGFNRPRFDAAYLIVDAGRAAFVDTGTNHAVPRLLATLDALGLAREAVDWVIPTHVHLDHAGGAGLLMSELPGARMLVHPRGARHMVDPSALHAGALAVYGQAEMDRAYGELVPVDESRVCESSDGLRVQVGTRELELIDTPGHARHHHCIWDERSRGWFTGDTFGLSYREFDVDGAAWILPTSTPVQFEPDAQKASVARMLQRAPRQVHLTHYGTLSEVPRLARDLCTMIDHMTGIARRAPPGDERHGWLKARFEELYLGSLQQHGCRLPQAQVRALLALDIELNAQGVGIWLDRSNEAKGNKR